VIAVGGWTVKLYMNIVEVVAILSLWWGRRSPARIEGGIYSNMAA
jgi:hypothetical protein